MLVVDIMACRDSVMDLININASEISEPTHFILLMYSAVKMTAASLKNLNTSELKKLTFLQKNHQETLREY